MNRIRKEEEDRALYSRFEKYTPRFPIYNLPNMDSKWEIEANTRFETEKGDEIYIEVKYI